MPPTIAPGKICYIQIPAPDVDRAAGFYGLRLEHTAAQRRRGRIRRHRWGGQRHLDHRPAALVGAWPPDLRAGRERGADTGHDSRGRR